MSQPPTYTPTTSFADDESNQASGRSTVRTAALDIELANVSDSVNALIQNLTLLQRDDGKVRDMLLEPYMLAEQLRAMLATSGVVVRGPWSANTAYALKDLVQRNGVALICQTPHNSGPTFNQGFWLAISGDGQAQVYAEQAGNAATGAAASAVAAAGSATTASTAASGAALSATAAAASQLAAQNAANSIAGLAPVNLNAFMLDLLANANAAGVRGDLDAVGATNLASTSDAAKGAGLVGFNPTLHYTTGTIGARLVAKVHVTDSPWLAKGDGLADDRAAIQSAIDYVSSVGGGIVDTSGPYRFRTTGTLYLKSNVVVEGSALPGFYYPSAGNRIVAEFASPTAWAIESDTRKVSDSTRVDYRSGISGIDLDNNIYTRNENCGLRNLYIEVPGNNLYGGVRLMGCPGALVENVGVERADIGFFFCASWGGRYRKLWSLTHLYGAAFAYDINAAEYSGYHVPVNGSTKTISAANRPNWVNPSDIGAAVGTRDFKDDKIGLLLYFTNAVHITQATLESWEVGRAYIACTALSEPVIYSEANTKTTLALISTDFVGDGAKVADTIAGNYYEFGVGATGELSNFPGRAANVSSGSRMRINTSFADQAGWKWSDLLRFPAERTSNLRVAAAGAVSNLATDTTYTTLDEALRRISVMGAGVYTVIIKDGDTVNLTTSAIFAPDTHITFKTESGGNASIKSTVSAGAPKTLSFAGNSGCTFRNVTLFFDTGVAASSFDCGFIYPVAPSGGGVFSFAMNGGGIALQSSFALFQQAFQSACTINASFRGATVTGSATAAIFAGASAGDATTVVTSTARSSPVDAAVKANGTNGWVNATVLASNF